MKKCALLSLLLLIIVCCKNEKKDVPQAITPIRLETRLDSLFNTHIAPDEPGAALLVAYNGKLLIGKGYGLRNLETKEPITPSTNMRMGSVSKQFTALTVLSLVDKGQLSLSDSVFSIYPYETFKNVTIEQLINHTSGVADAEEAFFVEWDTTKIATNEDVLEWYAQKNRSMTKPGDKYQYNNGIYEFIPSIVEKLSGQEFSEFADENIFEKAGMKRTHFFNLAKPKNIDERAYCYKKDSSSNWKKVDGHFLNGLLGAGGVYTSINDYFSYDQALRNESILSKEAHNLIFKPSSTYEVEGEKKHYAMGWGVTDSTAEHSGRWFGTNTIVRRNLNKPVTIAIFMNRNTLFEKDLIKTTYRLVDDYIKANEKQEQL